MTRHRDLTKEPGPFCSLTPSKSSRIFTMPSSTIGVALVERVLPAGEGPKEAIYERGRYIGSETYAHKNPGGLVVAF